MSLPEQLLTQENTPEYSYGLLQEETAVKRVSHTDILSSSVSREDNEYISTLKNALNQAVDENDMVMSSLLILLFF